MDEDQWSGWPAGFWNGATFEVFYGAAAGRTGTVNTSTAPGNGQGLTLNFNTSGVAPANGDYLIVRKTVPGGASQGWWPTVSGAGAITDNLTDLPPGTLGKQTVALSAPTASDSASIASYFDSTLGKTFLQLNGTYQLQFKAKGLSGTSQIAAQVYRSGVATYINQPVTLSGNWHTYTLTFTAAENGSAVGIAGVSFGTVGADSFELDDVSLSQINGDPTNTTAFRDPVVKALRTLQPGLIRYWGGQLGETLDNLLSPQFGRQRSGYSAFFTESDEVDYSLPEFLQLCQTIGAEPWFVVPSTFSTSDAANLIDYLGGDITTAYGAKRVALGQIIPWTQVFSKIHLEFGNEAWNSGFKGGSIEYPQPYGSRAQTIFGVMRAHPTFVAASFDLVLGGQAANPGLNTSIQNNCNNNDSFDIAPYTMATVNSFSDNESLFGSTFAEPEAYVSSSGTAEGLTPGLVYQDYQALQNSTHPVPLTIYEVNMGTLNGSITQQALNGYTPSLGAGLMVVDTMLQAMKQFGVVNQNFFALPQFTFTRPDGSNSWLWGAVIDMGVTDRRRPQFLAMQLANQALSSGAVMLQTAHTGVDPTWNQPLVNTVQLSGAHDLQSYAFQQGSNFSLIVFNLARSGALPVTFSGANAPTGTVQMQQLTSANPTDTNEISNVVGIQPSTLSNFNGATGLSLPPYSMTVLTWTNAAATSATPVPTPTPTPTAPVAAPTAPAPVAPVSAPSTPTPTPTPAPVVSAVTSSAISTSSATIAWTTDEPSTSQINYGIGNSRQPSPVNPDLVTSHSVTLGGLTAGATYNYRVKSVNSAGIYSDGPAASFSTLSITAASGPAPNVGYVAFWGVTGSSATISWSTDLPATTQVAYGTTPALGQLTPVIANLTNSHGVVLNGLTGGTTYYFVAQSTSAGGVTGSSQPQTFTTTNTATPTISNIAVSPGGNNSATISWTTSVPTYSYVQFGTTTAYGVWSPQTLLTANPQPSLGFVPSGLVHYQLVSVDANGNQTVSPDYTFIEP